MKRSTTRGEVVRVPSAQAIQKVLPSLVAQRIRRVVSRNLRTGFEGLHWIDLKTLEIKGAIPLAAGKKNLHPKG